MVMTYRYLQIKTNTDN